MNLYVVVEGQQTEKKVYRSWLKGRERVRSIIYDIEDARSRDDCLFLIAGHGYPSYLDRIDAAVEDVNKLGCYDKLIVCVDSEEEGFDEKKREIESLLEGVAPPCEAYAVIQTPCIETWFLGHLKLPRRKPDSVELKELLSYYPVFELDPESMGPKPAFNTAAQFHAHYFSAVCRERGLSYSKSNPGPVLEPAFCADLLHRHDSTGHIGSIHTLRRVLDAIEQHSNVRPPSESPDVSDP